MTMVLEYELYNFIFGTARIGHENTYDMRAIFQKATKTDNGDVDFWPR